jgi:hypothetical protein
MRHTLRNSVMCITSIRAPEETANFFYSILCECGRSYIAETDRPWAVRLREYR